MNMHMLHFTSGLSYGDIIMLYILLHSIIFDICVYK